MGKCLRFCRVRKERGNGVGLGNLETGNILSFSKILAMNQSQRARSQISSSSMDGEEVHFRRIDDLQSVGINVSDIKKVLINSQNKLLSLYCLFILSLLIA